LSVNSGWAVKRLSPVGRFYRVYPSPEEAWLGHVGSYFDTRDALRRVLELQALGYQVVKAHLATEGLTQRFVGTREGWEGQENEA